jgi:hypothetical protein
VKVGTPLGEYPFQFRRVERVEGGLAVTGLVAGMRSSVVLEPSDLRTAAKLLGPPLAALGLLAWLRRGRR